MSSQCFGQVRETEADSIMKRTKNRPMPKGRITSKHACFVGTGLTVSSLMAFHAFQPFVYFVARAYPDIFNAFLFAHVSEKHCSASVECILLKSTTLTFAQ